MVRRGPYVHHQRLRYVTSVHVQRLIRNPRLHSSLPIPLYTTQMFSQAYQYPVSTPHMYTQAYQSPYMHRRCTLRLNSFLIYNADVHYGARSLKNELDRRVINQLAALWENGDLVRNSKVCNVASSWLCGEMAT